MRKWVSIVSTVLLLAALATAADDRTKELERVHNASTVLQEIMSAPDKGIPEEILGSADCVVIIPSMKKAAFVVGGNYGKGVSTCRTSAGTNTWSAPAPVRIEGGSWGLQIGGQATDIVMLVMNQNGLQHLLSSKFKVGADASAAAGPVGRHAEAGTNWKMQSELLTYSRSRGAFAGISLNGSVVKQDQDDTRALYGRMIPFERILKGQVPAPPDTRNFVATVAKYFRQARTGQPANAKKTSSSGGGVTPSGSEASSTAMTTPETAPAQTASAPLSEMNANSQPQNAQAGAGPVPATSGGMAGTTAAGAQVANSTTAPGSGQSSVSTNAGGTEVTTTTTVETQQVPAGNTTTPTGNTAAAAGATSGVSAAEASVSNDDLRTSIQKALRDEPGLSTSNVNVGVTNNTIELSGTVGSQADRNRVLSIVGQQAGNRRVVDRDLFVK